MRYPTKAMLFLIASAAVIAGSFAWAWATYDFWNNVPLFPCAAAAGLLAAVATYLGRRRVFSAIVFGFGVAAVMLSGAALITIYRWEL